VSSTAPREGEKRRGETKTSETWQQKTLGKDLGNLRNLGNLGNLRRSCGKDLGTSEILWERPRDLGNLVGKASEILATS
jgi:hypothetical protein